MNKQGYLFTADVRTWRTYGSCEQLPKLRKWLKALYDSS